MKINAESVSKTFYRSTGSIHAVHEVSWRGSKGQVHGIIGPNGSGKTTLIRMILGSVQPDKGTIYVEGSDTFNQTQLFRNQTGYLPEERGVYPNLRAEEFLLYLAQLHHLDRDSALSRIATYLEELNLAGNRRTLLRDFSKGMLQKIQLIAAFLHNPSLIVLDEPFSGLDPVNIRLVRSFIQRHKKRGALVVLCTHMMDEAERLCDMITMFHKGRILNSGPTGELRRTLGEMSVTVTSEETLPKLNTAQLLIRKGSSQSFILNRKASLLNLLGELNERGITYSELHYCPTRLEEIFIRAIQDE